MKSGEIIASKEYCEQDASKHISSINNRAFGGSSRINEVRKPIRNLDQRASFSFGSASFQSRNFSCDLLFSSNTQLTIRTESTSFSSSSSFATRVEQSTTQSRSNVHAAAATASQASSATTVALLITEAAAVELEHAEPAAAADDFQGRLSPVHRLLRMRKASPARDSDSAALQRSLDPYEERFPAAPADAGALAWSVAPVASTAIATVGPRAVRPGPERRLWRPDPGEPALSAHSSAPSLAGPLARHGANRPAADAAAAQDRRSRLRHRRLVSGARSGAQVLFSLSVVCKFSPIFFNSGKTYRQT